MKDASIATLLVFSTGVLVDVLLLTMEFDIINYPIGLSAGFLAGLIWMHYCNQIRCRFRTTLFFMALLFFASSNYRIQALSTSAFVMCYVSEYYAAKFVLERLPSSSAIAAD